MKCPKCYSEIDANATQCPVCGEKVIKKQSAKPLSYSKPNSSAPKKSKLLAFVLAWWGFGILLPSYLDDQEESNRRLKIILKLAPLTLLAGIGLMLIFFSFIYWAFKDSAQILSSSYITSKGIKIWRKKND